MNPLPVTSLAGGKIQVVSSPFHAGHHDKQI